MSFEGNKIIGKFMGINILPNDTSKIPAGTIGVRECDLGYDYSWDLIMPVIRKINGLGKEFNLIIFKNYVSCTVEKGGKFYKDFSFSHAEYITSEQNDITAAFKLVVRFVEWYNINIRDKQEK